FTSAMTHRAAGSYNDGKDKAKAADHAQASVFSHRAAGGYRNHRNPSGDSAAGDRAGAARGEEGGLQGAAGQHRGGVSDVSQRERRLVSAGDLLARIAQRAAAGQ